MPDALARIIVGLGNPGEQYRRSRHNAGFMTVEALAWESGGRWSTDFHCRTCRATISGFPVLLAEPRTYMNHSGKAVYTLLSEMQRALGDLLVVLDDLSLPLGRIRIRERGSAGGHHGLESLLSIFGTEEILRVRMGIGEDQMPKEKSEFVLSDFPAEKQPEVDQMILNAGNAIKSILGEGVSKTMAIFNA
jgi:peptidyl-tRNA hydrolase, PTH1 family